MEMVSTCFANNGHCQHEASIFEAVDAPGEIFISKQPNDIKQIHHIFHRDEQLYIIYLTRDPRSVITSMHPQFPGQYFCNYRVWRECDRAARHYLGHPRFLQLRYEDLVTEPDELQAAIHAHFPFLKTRHLFSEYHKFASPSSTARQAMKGLRKIDLDSLSSWREHLPRIAHQHRGHPALADDLVRLGYEKDKDWLRILDGVTAIAYPCRYPEKRQYLKEWEKSLRVRLKSRTYLRQRALLR
jgi:hypothetical protein